MKKNIYYNFNTKGRKKPFWQSGKEFKTLKVIPVFYVE